MAIYIKKTGVTLFILGLLILTILSIIGMVYLSKMAFSEEKQADGQYCGNLSETERNIARIAIITIWLQFAWVVIGSVIQNLWHNSIDF